MPAHFAKKRSKIQACQASLKRLKHPSSIAFWVMQHLESRTLSTATLLRGVDLLKDKDMSLEDDPLYADLVAEHRKLLAEQALCKLVHPLHSLRHFIVKH